MDQGYNLGLRKMFLREMLKDDPKRAWEIASELPGPHRDTRNFGILLQILKSDPSIATEIVRANRADLSLNRKGWWGDDPMAVLPVLNELHAGPGRYELIYSSISKYVERSGNPNSVVESKKWFDQLNPELQALVLRDAKEKRFVMGSAEKLLEAWTRSDDGK
ncbi:hypothetical protein V2O64_11390 [Verrucomicrobiaceae bacterium 227]